MSVGVLLWAVSFAAASAASNLADVRVGPHGEYTRVVLETDAKAPYSLNQSEGVVTIELQAASLPKAVTAKSQQLSWVRVQPAGETTTVRIELKGPARVKQMVLTGPNRIVLDVYGGGAAAPTTASAAPSPAHAASASPVPAEPAPAESAATTPPVQDEDALIHKEADALLGPAAGSVPGDEIAATEGTPSDGAAAAEAGTPAEETATPLASAPAAAPKVQAKANKGVVDWILDPYVLGGIAIVMAALFFILRRRRPSSGASRQPAPAEEASSASLFGATAEAREEATAADETEAPRAAEAGVEATPSEEGGSPFEFEAPDADSEKPEDAPAQGATLTTIGAVTSTAAYETKAPTATGGLNMAELERRLSLLEQRLEEVIDAKDRLERQVSAQTEELRVQRAAIARTQRVLRTVVRPEDDQPSEPVMKS